MRAQLLGEAGGVLGMPVRDRNDHGLHRREPGRERAGVVLDEHADEPLHRTVERAVDHHRALMHVVFVRVLEAEAFWKIEIHLDRGDLPVATDRVAHVDVDLGSVERAVAFVHGEIDTGAP